MTLSGQNVFCCGSPDMNYIRLSQSFVGKAKYLIWKVYSDKSGLVVISLTYSAFRLLCAWESFGLVAWVEVFRVNGCDDGFALFEVYG